MTINEFDGAPDADGTMSDSIVGIEAVTRFYAIAFEAGRQSVIEGCDDGTIDWRGENEV